MRTRFTLTQLIQRGYCLGDIDHMVQMKFGAFASQNGVTVVNIADIHSVDEYFNERAERNRRR